MDQVTEVKAKTDIVSLISDYVTLTKAGKNYKGLCPFHSEKTPSFMVSPQLQMYRCFGCGESGDAFTFLEKHEGMDFYESLKYLADKAGVKLAPIEGRQRSDKDKYYQINREAMRFYQYLLIKHPEGKKALAYLKGRKIVADTLKAFQIGYSPTKADLLFSYLTKKKKYPPEDIEKAGLTYKSRGRYSDRFRGRVMFPIFDHRGNVVAFGGRILPENDNGKVAKYINSPDTPVYHKSYTLYGLFQTKGDIKRRESAVLVEGEFDLLSPWQAGVKNIAATKGTAVTAEQLSILSRYTKEILLAFDSDEAGVKAIRKTIEMADMVGLTTKVVSLGKYKDPDDFVKGDKEAFLKAAKEATPGWDFIVRRVAGKYNLNSGEGKAKVSQELVPFISKISDKIVKAHYIGVLANLARVPVEAVTSEVEEYEKKAFKPEAELVIPKKEETEKPRRELLEEELLSLILEEPEKVEKRVKKEKAQIKSPVLSKICSKILEFTESTGNFTIKEFGDFLPEELKKAFADLVLRDTDLTEDPAKIKKEITNTILEITRIDTKEKMDELASEISELERRQEKGKLKEKEREFALLSQKLYTRP